VSGLFLLDSESRLQLAAATTTKAPSPAVASANSDPVCGMEVDPAKAGHKSVHGGRSYFFCSASCKAKFDENPSKYVAKKDSSAAGGVQ
jgi:YHS domain-containing protein